MGVAHNRSDPAAGSAACAPLQAAPTHTPACASECMPRRTTPARPPSARSPAQQGRRAPAARAAASAAAQAGPPPPAGGSIGIACVCPGCSLVAPTRGHSFAWAQAEVGLNTCPGQGAVRACTMTRMQLGIEASHSRTHSPRGLQLSAHGELSPPLPASWNPWPGHSHLPSAAQSSMRHPPAAGQPARPRCVGWAAAACSWLRRCPGTR